MLNYVYKRFSSLGSISSRSMFGGYGIFSDEVMFALIVKNKLFLRIGDNANLYREKGYPYTYIKKGHPVITRYFLFENSNKKFIYNQACESLKKAKIDKLNKEKNKYTRIKDLPNLKLSTERMLKKSGIENVNELRRIGSVQAYKAIQKINSDIVDYKLLWSLEGAITGIHWSVISDSVKKSLKETLQN